MSLQEAPYKAIAARKQAERASKIPSEWKIPSNALPKDPPQPADGPQNVMHLPARYLSEAEIEITESYSVPSLLSTIASRRLTATEVTEAFCHRAAVAHQLTNCLTEILFDSAVQRATELDQYLKTQGRPFGPLHGLPVSVKDTFDVKGVDSSMGFAFLCFKPLASNDAMVDLLLSLGCVILAKTNIPQTLASLDSINHVFGRTMNPFNRLLTAGGSSGGEGVLVAMRGSMVGIGTDIGGSIRVPAMCNGIYGFKPSVGRLPNIKRDGLGLYAMSRTSVQSVAGPIARSVEDIDVMMKELVPRARLFSEDCFAGIWDTNGLRKVHGSGKNGEFVIGILRSDGNCDLLPPIRNVIDEVAEQLRKTSGVTVVDLETPAAWTRAQSVMNKLMSVDGGRFMFELMDATQEPLVPWLAARMKKGKPRTLDQVANLQAQRTLLERHVLDLWISQDEYGRRRRKLDAIVCPVAPHPVPVIEGYNSVGYTSSWVLLDMPAACIPIRDIRESDLELGRNTLKSKAISSWDEQCRELWLEDKTDRKVYLGSKLSVQVVVPKLEDQTLLDAMKIIEEAFWSDQKPRSRL